jgi:hypothetical protein
VFEVNKTLIALNLKGNDISRRSAEVLADALEHNMALSTLDLWGKGGHLFGWRASNEFVHMKERINALLERNRQHKLPYAQASLALLAKYSPVLKDVPADLISVLAEQLPNEVVAVFEQEWRDAFRVPPPPIITTTTNTTSTTTTTTTTRNDTAVPNMLTTSPTVLVTDMPSATSIIATPTATADEIKALLADPNPVVALSRWIDGHANPAAALNWVDPSNGYTLLHHAIAAQQVAVVQSLMERGIDLKKADHNNQTAAQLAKNQADATSSQTVAAIAVLFK